MREYAGPPLTAYIMATVPLYAGLLLVAYSARGRTPARWVCLAPRRLLPAGRQLRCRDRVFATPPPGDSVCTSAVSQSPQKTACMPRPPADFARRPRGCLTLVITTKRQNSASRKRRNITKKILKWLEKTGRDL